MMAIKGIVTGTGIALLFLSIVACTTLARRTPLEVTPYSQKLSLTGLECIHVIFEETLPNKPLNETVWDNAKGAFWDVEESKQIGFTQDYSKFIPVAVSAGIIGGAVGGAIAGLAAGPELVNTRIVIPFGRIFSKTVESIIADNSQQYSACYSPNCGIHENYRNALKIKVNEFYVWEGPLNHINLVVKGKSEYYEGGNMVTEYKFEKSVLAQKLGSMMSTHASFMKEMNRISNEFAQGVSTDIMNNVFLQQSH